MPITPYLTHDVISQRARTLWESQGRPEGRDLEHWLQAEAELRKESEQTPLVAKIPLQEGTTLEAANPRAVTKGPRAKRDVSPLSPKGGDRRSAPGARRG